MDVRMPDGTLIRNVPDGTTKAQLVERLRRNGYSVPQEWMQASSQENTRDPRYVIPDGPFAGRTRADLEAEVARNNEQRGSLGYRAKEFLLGTPAEAVRMVGRAGKNVAQGALSLPAMVMDAPAAAINAGSAALGSDFRAPMPFTGAVGSMDQMFPQLAPRNNSEQFVDRAAQALAGAATGIGVGGALAGSASPVAARVGQTLVQGPGIQAASAVTGTAASEGARRAGAGPVGQLVAGVAGGMVPSVAVAGGAATVRGITRGGESGRQQLAQNVDDFAKQGTTPTVGQGTERRTMRAAESLLSRTPGGAGPIVRRAETQAQELADAIEVRASKLMGKSSAEQAGRQIERSVRGVGGFIERFRATQSKAYQALDDQIGGAKPIDVSNTRKALSELSAPIPGARNVSSQFQNSRLSAIRDQLERDLQPDQMVNAPGKLPYEALARLRTLVGNELSDAGLASDVPRSKWKALYAALSKDLEGAAKESGPRAQQAWARANNLTRAGMARIEKIESVIDRQGGPEAIFRAATAGTKEGASTLRAVMQSVDDTGRKMVTATVLRRLGLAKAGVQNELGDQFSTESFLTNWNLLSKEAKATLFDRYGPTFRQDMDALARVASNLRAGSQVFRNPSGTAQASAQQLTAGAAAISLLTGQFETAATIGGVAGMANLTSRLMANPRFVRWLAQSTKTPQGSYAAQVNLLAQMARSSGDEDLARAAALLESAQKANEQNDDRQR